MIVCTWTWLFIRHLDPVATAEFYRSLSRRRKPNSPKKPILGGAEGKEAASNGVNNSLNGLQLRGDEGYVGYPAKIYLAILRISPRK